MKKKDYGFDISALVQTSDKNASLFVGLKTQDTYDNSLNFKELPKLSKGFSVTIDIPIFNNTASSNFINKSENNIYIHTELADSWNENTQFLCFLMTRYDEAIDKNLPNCGTQALFLLSRNQQCVKTHNPECYTNPFVVSVADAKRQAKNIDCTFSSNDLTKGKDYDIIIMTSKKLGSNIYVYYAYSKERTEPGSFFII